MKQILPIIILMLAVVSVSAQERSEAARGIHTATTVSQESLVKVINASEPSVGGQHDEDGYELRLNPLYPNPASESITVSGEFFGLPADDFLWLTLIELNSGEIFYEDYIVVQETIEQQIDLSEIPDGMFVAFYQTTDGKFRAREILMIRR